MTKEQVCRSLHIAMLRLLPACCADTVPARVTAATRQVAVKIEKNQGDRAVLASELKARST